jgi:hypothetical protein
MLDNLVEIRKQSVLEEAEEPVPEVTMMVTMLTEGAGLTGAGIKEFENNDSNEHRAATTRQEIMWMLSCCEEILKKRYLRRQISVLEFFKSCSGTRLLIPELTLAMMIQMTCLPSKSKFRRYRHIFSFLFQTALPTTTRPTLTLHLWENVSRLTLSRLPSSVSEPVRRNLGGWLFL